MEDDISELRKAQLRMLDILVEVDKVATRHGITYWLDGGTLLGAIRHNGFIPWDDDLDIALFRRDYKRLCRYLKKELPDWCFFQDETTEPGYYLRFAKVRDMNSELIEKEHAPLLTHNGIFIDIFPIEKFGSMAIKSRIDSYNIEYFRQLKYEQPKSENKRRKLKLKLAFLRVAIFFARVVSWLIPRDVYSYGYGINLWHEYRKDTILPVSLMRCMFEGLAFPVPCGSSTYLSSHFGEWRTLPPDEQRSGHAKQINFK